MIILPAIDIKDGCCVRLLRGDFDTANKVAENALDTARMFYMQGARWLHMVDLDGARTGGRVNSPVFLEIAEKTKLKIELGGGIRDMESVSYYLEHGIARVILGSSALSRPGFVRAAVKEYGERIAVGIDALNGKVAAEGWLKVSTVGHLDFARQMENIGVKYIIFTDVSKDGMMGGPNLDMLAELSQNISCNIIASGGIRNVSDIGRIAELGLYGAICGRSIYVGALDLEQAVMKAGVQDAG